VPGEKSGNRGNDPDQTLNQLRDRTDELELIISSLTIFALVSIPGWLLDQLADVYTHLSTELVIATTTGTTIISGTSYGLAVCFVVHLMARAYWVGLIGLRYVFPSGINWDRTPGLGPLTRKNYRETLPNLDSVIRGTDKLASSLFAVISMLTLSLLWFGSILIGTVVAAGAVGAQFGRTNAGIVIGTGILLVLFVGTPMLLYLLDAQLARRIPRLQTSRVLTSVVRALHKVLGLAYPRRLVLPVQLTLQSNTRPLAFFIALTLGIVAIVSIGGIRSTSWRNFTLSDEFRYLDDEQIADGFRSSYYEDMASPKDRLSGTPRIDSFHQDGSFVRLFLPYFPLRDNLVLDQRCGDASAGPGRTDCLRELWVVSIEGESVPMSSFLPAERRDLNMRGLVGLVPLSGIQPGQRNIEVIWNPGGVESLQALDDRYTELDNRFIIPIAFSPAFERALPETDDEEGRGGTE